MADPAGDHQGDDYSNSEGGIGNIAFPGFEELFEQVYQEEKDQKCRQGKIPVIDQVQQDIEGVNDDGIDLNIPLADGQAKIAEVGVQVNPTYKIQVAGKDQGEIQDFF